MGFQVATERKTGLGPAYQFEVIGATARLSGNAKVGHILTLFEAHT